MDPSIDQIEALALHEEAIGNLYDMYASRFPDHDEFWTQLAKEERGHAALVRSLRKLVDEGRCTINEERFRINPIEVSINYINLFAKNAFYEDMTILNALSIAFDIETALLDRKFLEVYETDDEDIKEILTVLTRETAKHREVIESKLHEARLELI